MTIDKYIKLKENLELQKYVRNPDFDKKTAVHSMVPPKSTRMNRTGLF